MQKRTARYKRAILVGLISGNLCGLPTLAYLLVVSHWFRQVVDFKALETAITAEMNVMDSRFAVTRRKNSARQLRRHYLECLADIAAWPPPPRS